jgi:hypothetical protein
VMAAPHGRALAQEKSVRPGINKPYENADVNSFIVSVRDKHH